MIPPTIHAALQRLMDEKKSVTVALNIKEGRIISFEVSEKHRI